MKISSVAALVFLSTESVLTAPTIRAMSASSFEIQWTACPNFTNLDCGELKVPIDWDNPSGDQVTLGMTRINATEPSNRIGSLLFNPGGPGEVATEICQYQALGAPIFNETLLEHFDIICPDPRGIGRSTPVQCDPDVWNNYNVSLFPSDEASFGQLVAANKARGANCRNLTGPLLEHIDTTSVARDFEAIRIALNDGKLNYIGLSYGTFLGASYAELFPNNIRSMVLDGAINMAQAPTDLIYTESSTYQNVLNRFFDWCASNSTACGGYQGTDPAKLFDNLVASARKAPIPAPGCAKTSDTNSAGSRLETVTAEDILFNVQGILTFKYPLFGGLRPDWSTLGLALNQSIAQNNATLLSTSIATSETDSLYPDTAIACLDFPRPSLSNLTQAWAAFNTWQTMGSVFNPEVGSASQSYQVEANCIGWPIAPTYSSHILNQTAMAMVPPLLMVNAEHDPSTSYVWASGLTQQIPSAVLLTRDGDGHTSFFLDGEATAVMNTYLVHLTLPALGTIVKS